jgi:hypothetical protein
VVKTPYPDDSPMIVLLSVENMIAQLRL